MARELWRELTTAYDRPIDREESRKSVEDRMAATGLELGSVAYEALIDVTGSPRLGDVLLDVADSHAGVDEVFGYWTEEGQGPVQIASSGRAGSSSMRASMYADHFHLLDPLGPVIRSVRDGAPTQSLRILAHDISDPLYRRECYERPGFAEKISFVRTRGARHFVLSFYRRRQRAMHANVLTDLADIAFPVLRKHADLVKDRRPLSSTEKVEERVAQVYSQLTARELQVCARTLIGMTAEAIAIDLGVRSSTVMTYRRRAYERYGLSSASQMLPKLLT